MVAPNRGASEPSYTCKRECFAKIAFVFDEKPLTNSAKRSVLNFVQGSEFSCA